MRRVACCRRVSAPTVVWVPRQPHRPYGSSGSEQMPRPSSLRSKYAAPQRGPAVDPSRLATQAQKLALREEIVRQCPEGGAKVEGRAQAEEARLAAARAQWVSGQRDDSSGGGAETTTKTDPAASSSATFTAAARAASRESARGASPFSLARIRSALRNLTKKPSSAAGGTTSSASADGHSPRAQRAINMRRFGWFGDSSGTGQTWQGWDIFGTAWAGRTTPTPDAWERHWSPAGMPSPMWLHRRRQAKQAAAEADAKEQAEADAKKQQEQRQAEDAAREKASNGKRTTGASAAKNTGLGSPMALARTLLSKARAFADSLRGSSPRLLATRLRAWFLSLGLPELALLTVLIWWFNPLFAPALKWLSDRPWRMFVKFTGLFVSHEPWMGKHHPLGDDWEDGRGPWFHPTHRR